MKKTKEDIGDITKNKNKKIVILVVSLAIIMIASVLVITQIIVPTNKYNEATAFMESGKIDAAYEVFKELGDFKDSEELRNEIDYLRSEKLIASKSWKEAYLLLSKIRGYKDSDEIMKQLERERPHLSILLAKKGQFITFGEYEQDNNISNGKEPIEWIVLSNKKGNIYLLSKYVLDVQQFNITNVKECSLDDWLKTTFSRNAFKSINDDIITRVGILHKSDIDNYGMTEEQTIAEYTNYALNQKPEYGYASGLMWWLIDDTLSSSRGTVSAPVVWSDGSYAINSCHVSARCGVRPAMWIFADPDEIPADPVFDGSSPVQLESSSSSSGENGTIRNYCSSCGGDGKTHDWGTEMHGSGYACTDCGGDGWIEDEDL